ncbi:DUF885 domain-containing protein [Babesia caballi]|uniref:DUF885 domain-containing protein n=1 Tax=Babesia caballi TaxID=5871 RepID=A0AAV4LUK4_BABCB|nr:DUF885 domain-containing protein [Babesia caballi]
MPRPNRRALPSEVFNVNASIPEEEAAFVRTDEGESRSYAEGAWAGGASGQKGAYNATDESDTEASASSVDDLRDLGDRTVSSCPSQMPSSLNRGSFSGTFTSFIEFCNRTRGRYRLRGSNSNRSIAESSSILELTESQLSIAGMPQGERDAQPRHAKSMQAYSERAATKAEDETPADGGKRVNYTETRLGETAGQEPGQPRGRPSAAATSTAGKDVLRRRSTDTRSGRKYWEDHLKQTKKQIDEIHGPMATCYVLSKDQDSIYKKVAQVTNSKFKISFVDGKTKLQGFGRTLGCKTGCRKQDTGFFRRLWGAWGMKLGRPGADNFKGLSPESRMSMPSWCKARGSDAARSAMSYVTVVNKGNSNVTILKFQSSCKNYMDVNPDYGWRRLVEEYAPVSAEAAQERGGDETYAQRSYMYYRESKKMIHVIGLAELAINVACRALILGVGHGVIDGSGMPPFITNVVREHYDDIDEYETLRTRESEGKNAQHAMFFRSSTLGLFVTSSIRAVLEGSEYREAMRKSKRSFRWSMPFGGEDAARGANGSDGEEEADVFRFIPVPDYGWKLLERAHFDRHYCDNARQRDAKGSLLARLRNICGGGNVSELTASSVYSNAVLCKIKPPHASDRNAFIHVDVGSVAMNMAEQLYRLEIRQEQREKLPKSTFGFKVQTSNVVKAPCGTEFNLLPEELILNTATLVHEIYVTQTCLIL